MILTYGENLADVARDAGVLPGLRPVRDRIRGTVRIRFHANKNRIAVVDGAVPTGGLLELVARERRAIVRGIPPLGHDSIPRPFERIQEQRGRASKGPELNPRGENRVEENRSSARPDAAR